MHSENKVCMCVWEGEQETDLFAVAWLVLWCCFWVCLCAKAEWLSERLPPRWRLMNGGGHGDRRFSQPFQSLLSNEAARQHASSFQPPRLNAFCGSLLQVCTFVFKKKKKYLIYFPVNSLSNLQGFKKDNLGVHERKQATKSCFPQLPSNVSAGGMNEDEEEGDVSFW